MFSFYEISIWIDYNLILIIVITWFTISCTSSYFGTIILKYFYYLVYHRISIFILMLIIFEDHLRIMYIKNKSCNIVCKSFEGKICSNQFTGISFFSIGAEFSKLLFNFFIPFNYISISKFFGVPIVFLSEHGGHSRRRIVWVKSF